MHNSEINSLQNMLRNAENHELSARYTKSKTREKNVEEIMEKGLNPPKDDSERKNNSTDSLRTATVLSPSGLFDVTQWERTRFSTEAAIDKENLAQMVNQSLDPEESMRRRIALECSSKQRMVIRGEYLNEKPKFTITLLGIEVIWCAVCILVWTAAAVNPIVPLMIAICNMLVVFLLILVCLSVEVFRLQVRKEDIKEDARYFIPYSWRYTIFEVHVARAVLLCANITVMVFDDDFDKGSIIVLAATPIQLILVVIHIVLTFKRKYQ